MAMFAVVLVVVVAASASALSPSLPGLRGQMTDGTRAGGTRSRCHLVALAPALSRICEILYIYAARLGRIFNTHSYADI